MAKKRLRILAGELAVFVFLFGLTWYSVSVHVVHEHLYRYLANERGGLYTTMLTVEVTLLGFIIAILTIVLGYAQATRFEIVRRSRHWLALFESYTRAMRWAAYAAASYLIGLLVDRDSNPHPAVTALCLAALLMSTAVLARMLWVTERVVHVVVTPGERRPGE